MNFTEQHNNFVLTSIAGQEEKMRQTRTRWTAVVVLFALCGCSKLATTSESSNASEGKSTASGGQQNEMAQPASTPKAVVVDAIYAGTVIEVTINQSISSKTNNPGDHFNASVAAPVIVGDKRVIPPGARASGTVAVVRSAGRFKGSAELDVTLDSITVNHKTYHIQTAGIEEAGKGRGKRIAFGAGDGAAFGPIAGAFAEGGKGAAISAGAGAGAGTAGVAFTGKQDITLPAETKLTFRLTNPVGIRENG